MSKGSNPRPVDSEKFENNFGAIFGDKKPERGSFVWCEETKRMVPKEEYFASYTPSAHYVMPDIQPYQSMQTGEMINSRSQHRSHLKQHGLVEIGNEIKTAMTRQAPDHRKESAARKQAIAEVMRQKGYL